MTILITGASGFIGGHVTERLLSTDVPIRIITRRDKPLEIAGEERLERVHADILDRDALVRAMDGIDVVMHLAAELRMGEVTRDVLWQSNVRGAKNVIEACESAQVRRLIFCSSVGVLGNIVSGQADEDTPPRPDDPYEQTKLEGEKMALEAASRRLSVVIARPAWVYGPRDTRTLKLFRMIARGRMFLIGSGQNKQHPVHVHDVADGLIAAMNADVPSGTILHLAGPRIVTIRQLLQTVADLLGTRLLPFRFPLSLARIIAFIAEPLYKRFDREAPLTRGKLGFFVKNRAYSFEKTTRLIGWQPTIDIEEGLPTTLNWYKEHAMLP